MKLFAVLALLGFGFLIFRSVSSANELPAIGQPAPPFNLVDAKNQSHQLSDYAGKWLVLYFYPKDDTPGCTKEACHLPKNTIYLSLCFRIRMGK